MTPEQEKIKETIIKYIDDYSECSKAATRCMSNNYTEYYVDDFLQHLHKIYKVHEFVCSKLDDLLPELGDLISHSFNHIYKVLCEIIKRKLITKTLAEKYNIAIVFLSVNKSYKDFVKYYGYTVGGILLRTLRDISKEKDKEDKETANKSYFDSFIEEMVKDLPKDHPILKLIEVIKNK